MIATGEPTHRAVVQVYDGRLIGKDELARYVGPPDWKFEPLDPEARAEWAETIADPHRSLQENLRTRAVARAPMSEAEKAREQAIHAQRGKPVRLEY